MAATEGEGKRKANGRHAKRLRAVLRLASIAPVTNKFGSAYFRELGKKGGKTSGDSKRRSPEHYARMVEIRRKKAKLSAKK